MKPVTLQRLSRAMRVMSRRRGQSSLSGLLLVDKPSGITSFDVVARLRRVLGTRRIGHTGTLDPMATGLMAVLIGRGTKLAPYVTDTRKSYRAVARLGLETNTYDAEGEIVAEASEVLLSQVTERHVQEALAQFRGPIKQRPPAFSAIKVDGERLYAKARRGEEVTAPIRDVVVHEVTLLSHELPSVEFFVDCSKGTYIRSIAHDLGQTLNVGAHLTALRRTRVGAFELSDAWTLDALEALPEQARIEAVKPLRDAVSHLRTVVLDAAQERDARHGKRFVITDEAQGICAALNESAELIAVVEVSAERELRVLRGIPAL